MHEHDYQHVDEDAVATYEPPLLTTIGSVREVTLTETDAAGLSKRI
jgi:hypothetical protein